MCSFEGRVRRWSTSTGDKTPPAWPREHDEEPPFYAMARTDTIDHAECSAAARRTFRRPSRRLSEKRVRIASREQRLGRLAAERAPASPRVSCRAGGEQWTAVVTRRTSSCRADSSQGWRPLVVVEGTGRFRAFLDFTRRVHRRCTRPTTGFWRPRSAFVGGEPTGRARTAFRGGARAHPPRRPADTVRGARSRSVQGHTLLLRLARGGACRPSPDATTITLTAPGPAFTARRLWRLSGLGQPERESSWRPDQPFGGHRATIYRARRPVLVRRFRCTWRTSFLRYREDMSRARPAFCFF